MDFSILQNALIKAWNRDTSYCSVIWHEKNPALGQCAVTALVVNDYLGGEIVWSEAILPNGEKISHYFNFINGREVDLTRAQFPSRTIIPEGIQKCKEFATTREFILSNPNTRKRYEILAQRVKEDLKHHNESGP